MPKLTKREVTIHLVTTLKTNEINAAAKHLAEKAETFSLKIAKLNSGENTFSVTE